MALRELVGGGAIAGAPDELKLLSNNVGRIHGDEYFRATTLHQPPRVVRWREPVEMEEAKE